MEKLISFVNGKTRIRSICMNTLEFGDSLYASTSVKKKINTGSVEHVGF